MDRQQIERCLERVAAYRARCASRSTPGLRGFALDAPAHHAYSTNDGAGSRFGSCRVWHHEPGAIALGGTLRAPPGDDAREANFPAVRASWLPLRRDER